MSKKRITFSAMMTVMLCALLIVFTYSWVVRNTTPSLRHDNLHISSAGALVVSLDGDGNYDSVDLNNVIGLESFVFKQVSSVDGKNFLWLDFTPTLEDKPAVYRNVTDAQKGNYIDTRFAIKLDDSLDNAKYVFLHPECIIKDASDSLDVAKAIRIALDYDVETADGEVVNYTYILGNTPDGVLVDYSTDAVKKDSGGKSQDDPTATEQQMIYSFDYFNGGRTGGFNSADPSDPDNYNFVPDSKKCLFKIEPGSIQWINMRIWLEGADDNCVNLIAGQSFNMVLKFDSIEVPEA